MPARGPNSKLRWNAARVFGSIAAEMITPNVRRRIVSRSLTCRRAALSFSVVSLFWAGAATGQTDPPVPAPGQNLPAHASGGWPTELTGDAEKPARTPEQQARLDAVANELKRLANESGPDSVVLQAKLLMRSMGAGAVGPTEVKVAGKSAKAGPDFLEIDIETGLFFDGKFTTAELRRDTIWKDIAAPVLDEMVSFKIEPSALELVFLYNVQDFPAAAEPVADLGAPSEREAFRAQLSRAVLTELIDDTLQGEAVRAKVVFTPEVAVAPTGTPPAGTP